LLNAVVALATLENGAALTGMAAGNLDFGLGRGRIRARSPQKSIIGNQQSSIFPDDQ
jgi:hypothetical protein